MCKIATFTFAGKLDLKKTAESIGNTLLAEEQDGFGYAVQTSKGVFGEKCVADTFKPRIGNKFAIQIPVIEKRYSSFGTYEKTATGPAIFHGRTSTNDKGLLNCHPMQRESWHLIHNGVVTDNGPKYQKNTTNDSEDLLHRLIQGIKHVERELSGYYAFTAIDPQGRLHVCRDDNATLFMAWCPEVESYLIATTEELLETIAKDLKIKIGPIDAIMENVYMIFEGNELKYQTTIRPRGFDSRQSVHAERSLGFKLDDWTGYTATEGKSFDQKLMDENNESRFNDYSVYQHEVAQREELDALMAELESMTDEYTITDYDGKKLTSKEYYRLDEISRLECTIQRPDGTYLDVEGAYDVA